jgi:hypothetical protein
MSIGGDYAREDSVQFFCQQIAKKIKKYPDSAKALKELGLEALMTLPNAPEWANEYFRLFRE